MQRTLPLYDAKAVPPNWNERMADGEYAVLFHNAQPSHFTAPSCIVFSSLAEAEEYARAETTTHATMRCAIYDHRGLAAPPAAVIAGEHGADKSFLSAGFRRWVGGSLFLVGLVMIVADWRVDFRYFWPSAIGFRMAPVGMILLLTEAGVMLSARGRRPARPRTI